jgi:GMP synthase-like glutamine amidotransferase
MHQDEISGMPTGVQLLASTEKCENQGMYQKGRLITVQGHPEFTEDMVKYSLDARQDIFPPDVYKDAIRRLKDHDDGMIITQAFLRFLLEED